MSNVQAAQSIYDAFARFDIPPVLAAMDPEVQWRQAEGSPYQPDGAAWTGPQTVLEKLFMRIGAEWDALGITIRSLHDAGEYVVMEGRYTGTFKPTGRNFDAQVCHVLRFRNGKLVSFQQYTDTAQQHRIMTP
jgi:ketosteroid isomerase-like protein